MSERKTDIHEKTSSTVRERKREREKERNKTSKRVRAKTCDVGDLDSKVFSEIISILKFKSCFQ